MQSPFVTLFLNLDANDEYAEEVALIISEILRQRIQGIKNEKGIYTTPTFPKLVYVLHQHNCLEGGKYDYIKELLCEKYSEDELSICINKDIGTNINTMLYFAKGSKVLGVFAVADAIKKDSKEAIYLFQVRENRNLDQSSGGKSAHKNSRDI